MVTRKMRMLAASLALVLCVSLYSVPRSKAVATEVAVGTAAVASYFQATGLTMAASAGSTGALITTGVADIAGSYAMATGAASSGSAFLSSVAAGVSISPAGAIVLTAAAVVAIGALVAWYIGENGLEEEGDTATLIEGTFENYTFGGHELPALPLDISDYTSVFIYYQSAFKRYTVTFADKLAYVNSSTVYLPAGVSLVQYEFMSASSSSWENESSQTYSSAYGVCGTSLAVWSAYDIARTTGAVVVSGAFPVGSGDPNGQLEIARNPEFSQPDQTVDSDSLQQMVIDAGFPAGTTLDTVSEEVPNLIAAGILAPTYEITTTEPDTGTDTEPEEETGIYIPVLSDIKTRLDTLGDSIADKIMTGLQSLFVPDEAFFAEAVPELQETFQGRMGLLTFPISLLADFLGRLSNLGDQPPILTWGSVSIYGTELIAAGSYNLRDALKSEPVNQMYTIYMIVVNASLIFAFLALCHSKYRKIMQN